MLNDQLAANLSRLDKRAWQPVSPPPTYDAATHYVEVSRSGYYRNLVLLRHAFKEVCDDYMSHEADAVNVDMYMYTQSASSPMGPGSDSMPVSFEFDGRHTFLTDSAQFGFEPVLLNGIERAYSYLPSLRGEDPDYRHLNQFYHCEIELVGSRQDAMDIAEGLVKQLCAGFIQCSSMIRSMSVDPAVSLTALHRVVDIGAFPVVPFDDACALLEDNGHGDLVNVTAKGRDISSKGELMMMQLLSLDTPTWVVGYDRDRVAFYQKPDPVNDSKVLNADLLFPPLHGGSLGGEVVGLGQRQDDSEELVDSLRRQSVDSRPYQWYIELRKDPRYRATAGFGLGIERFIAWSLGLSTIRDAILFPRLKGETATP